MTRAILSMCLVAVLVRTAKADERSLPLVDQVPAQPLWAQVQRVVEAMDHLGHPFSDATKATLDKASKEKDDAALVRGVQDALDPYCLLAVDRKSVV